MPGMLVCQVNWNHTAIPLHLPAVRLHTIHVGPEPAHPFGRKGLALASAWEQLRTPSSIGMLILDGDVVIDPHDLLMMFRAVTAEPDAVHAAPARLWPKSTMRAAWVWSVFDGTPTQELPEHPTNTSFCCTFLPKRLIDRCIRYGLKKQRFPGVDTFVSAQAVSAGIPIRIVRDAAPKHLHY